MGCSRCCWSLASLLLIANTIRLSLYARRREVEVMKLVGATDWFIRWPFVIEGVVVGALGGIIAILLLGVGKVALVDPLASDFALIAAPDTMNFGLLVARAARRRVGVSARSAPACRCAASCASRAGVYRLHGRTVVRDAPPPLAHAVARRPAARRARARRLAGRASGNLPGPVRDVLVGDDARADLRRGDRHDLRQLLPQGRPQELLDKASGPAVELARRPLLRLLRPEAVQAFQEATDGAFEGVGMNVAEVDRGLRVLTVFDGSPAEPRRAARGRRDHRRQRQVARRASRSRRPR